MICGLYLILSKDGRGKDLAFPVKGLTGKGFLPYPVKGLTGKES